MPTSVYYPRPVWAGGPANGSCSAYMEGLGAFIIHTAELTVGVVTGKFASSTQMFVRWDIDIPAGATIDGVQITWTSSGTRSFFGQGPQVVGWHHAQANAAPWESANGVGAWVFDTEALLSSTVGRTVKHDDVFWGGVPAFRDDRLVPLDGDPPPVNLDEKLYYSDGIAAADPFHDTLFEAGPHGVGIKAQLQSYLDGNEALRAGGLLPCLFSSSDFTPGGGDRWARFWSGQNAVEDKRPKLTIEWTEPPLGAPIGTTRARAAVAGRPTSRAAVSGQAADLKAVSSRPSNRAAVSATLRTRAVVSGRPRSGGDQ